ncbi:Metallo-beta-lactamase superfamily enzyme [Halomicrobium sp. LC1Hm]|nr:Metallo-beta-lactamase superfamily enzyme [Halomicrobium sp. LC1Hm]
MEVERRHGQKRPGEPKTRMERADWSRAMYEREDATEYALIDRWDDGFGWFAHPEEDGQRASHAVRASDDGSTRGDGGVWLFDPIDAPGIDERVHDLGEVAGVVVLSDYHARDAGTFARRHGVSVHVPDHLDRSAQRVDAPVERVSGSVAGFELTAIRPLRAWREVLAYRESDGTLYVPDFLAGEKFAVGSERLGMPFLSRLSPPRRLFADCDPDRILLGHGEGVFDDASAALTDTVTNARARFPRALANAPTEIRAVLDAVR